MWEGAHKARRHARHGRGSRHPRNGVNRDGACERRRRRQRPDWRRDSADADGTADTDADATGNDAASEDSDADASASADDTASGVRNDTKTVTVSGSLPVFVNGTREHRADATADEHTDADVPNAPSGEPSQEAPEQEQPVTEQERAEYGVVSQTGDGLVWLGAVTVATIALMLAVAGVRDRRR